LETAHHAAALHLKTGSSSASPPRGLWPPGGSATPGAAPAPPLAHYYSARDREEPYYSARDREEPPSQLHHHIIPISFGSLISVEYHVNLNPHVPHESSPSQPSWAITGHPVPLTWPSRLPWSFMMYRLLVIQTYPRNIPLFSIVLISPGPTGGARGVDARPTLRRSVCYPASYCPR
jgi:hypothetical protein